MALLAVATAAAPAHAAGSDDASGRRDYVLLAPAHVPLTEPGREQPLDQLLRDIRSTPPGPNENHAPRAARRSGQDELAAYECREQDSAFRGAERQRRRPSRCASTRRWPDRRRPGGHDQRAGACGTSRDQFQ